MSRVVAADLSARSSLKKSEAIAAIKARASLIADFKNGEYKLYTPETGLARTDFASMFNFTRTSVASVDTYAGVADIASGQPRFSAGKGLRIEESRENLLTYSEDLSDAAYNKTGVTITTDSEGAPDGSTTADTLVTSAVNEFHAAQATFPSAAGLVLSWFVKAAGYSRVGIGLASGDSPVGMDFDLKKKVFRSPSADWGFGTPDSFGFVEYPNGYFRVWISTSGNYTRADIYILDAEGNRAFLGDGSNGIIAWGAQLEVGTFPTSYIPTAASSAVRDAEPLTRTLGAEFNNDSWTLFVDFDELLPTYGQNTALFELQDGSGYVVRIIRFSTDNLRIDLNGEQTLEFDAQGLGPLKMALSYDGEKGFAYVNGTIKDSDPVTLTTLMTTLAIGAGTDLGDRDIKIDIKEIGFLPEALTADELRLLTEPD